MDRDGAGGRYPRLRYEDLTAEHLRALISLVEENPRINGRHMIEDIIHGKLELYDLGDALIGIVDQPECTWCEVLIGRGVIARADEIITWLRSRGKPLRGNACGAVRVRMYERLGFKAEPTEMRMD